MSIVEGYTFEPMIGDPDDHRPGTVWSILVDPGGPDGRVDDLALITERIGPGDRIPLHVHRVSEVLVIHGDGAFRLGDTVHRVREGAVVFVPAGVAHGLHNDGDAPLPLEAAFPTTSIWIRTLERNPAPGTEHEPPRAGATYDVRARTVTFDEPA